MVLHAESQHFYEIDEELINSTLGTFNRDCNELRET